MFKKYQHIERFGTDEVEGIEVGESWVFPKIDGSCGSIWIDENVNIKAGSRSREVSLELDNQGFYKAVLEDERVKEYLLLHPRHMIFCEWLVRHSLKTYRDDAWNKFYIFDVVVYSGDDPNYIPYEQYKDDLDKYGLDYIPALAQVKNANIDTYMRLLQNNYFLIKDDSGIGEGIVIKNYGFYNKYGRQTWAKVTTNEFKDKHRKEMGHFELKGKDIVEQKIVDKYCTEEIIEKAYQKIRNANNGWRSEYIPRLLNTVFHDIFQEEIWNIIKENKNPSIDFRVLLNLVIYKIKEVKKDVF